MNKVIYKNAWGDIVNIGDKFKASDNNVYTIDILKIVKFAGLIAEFINEDKIRKQVCLNFFIKDENNVWRKNESKN